MVRSIDTYKKILSCAHVHCHYSLEPIVIVTGHYLPHNQQYKVSDHIFFLYKTSINAMALSVATTLMTKYCCTAQTILRNLEPD